ncbi:hypothetical protein V6N12_054857 [Hibiscus sabdariffa]|uniref:Cytochrome P450 n=1 Tax=Hibiscus sabdariffa TaxID=183260 RepID=A0ABR2D2G3_9ROSI
MQLFGNSSRHAFLWKLSQKYCSLLYLRLGCKPTIVVSTAKICRLSGDSRSVNLSEAMMCLSSTTICRVGFGKRYDEEGAQEDIIDVLPQISKDDDFPFDLTIDHIKAILSWLSHLYHTSAATVTWVMSFLMKNPKCLKRTQAEVRSFIGKKGFLKEDDLQSLTYLKGVIKETFRLQPIAPLLVPRETLRKCSIGGYEVPAKCLVHVNAWAIGRDPEP